MGNKKILIINILPTWESLIPHHFLTFTSNFFRALEKYRKYLGPDQSECLGK